MSDIRSRLGQPDLRSKLKKTDLRQRLNKRQLVVQEDQKFNYVPELEEEDPNFKNFDSNKPKRNRSSKIWKDFDPTLSRTVDNVSGFEAYSRPLEDSSNFYEKSERDYFESAREIDSNSFREIDSKRFREIDSENFREDYFQESENHRNDYRMDFDEYAKRGHFEDFRRDQIDENLRRDYYKESASHWDDRNYFRMDENSGKNYSEDIETSRNRYFEDFQMDQRRREFNENYQEFNHYEEFQSYDGNAPREIEKRREDYEKGYSDFRNHQNQLDNTYNRAYEDYGNFESFQSDRNLNFDSSRSQEFSRQSPIQGIGYENQGSPEPNYQSAFRFSDEVKDVHESTRGQFQEDSHSEDVEIVLDSLPLPAPSKKFDLSGIVPTGASNSRKTSSKTKKKRTRTRRKKSNFKDFMANKEDKEIQATREKNNKVHKKPKVESRGARKAREHRSKDADLKNSRQKSPTIEIDIPRAHLQRNQSPPMQFDTREMSPEQNRRSPKDIRGKIKSSQRPLAPPMIRDLPEFTEFAQPENNSIKRSLLHMEAATPGFCPCCSSKQHNLDECQSFIELGVERRWRLVKKFANVCHICLKTGHNHKVCGNYIIHCLFEECSNDREHHTLLHRQDNGVVISLDDELDLPSSYQCSLCKSTGHQLKSCPELFCYVCKKQGHFAKDCKGTSKQICQYCKMPGHGISICPIVICRRCGQQGHTDLTCTDDISNKTQVSQMKLNCFECGEVGHHSNDCPNILCKICRKRGHRAKQCTQKCSYCGSKGHTIKECPLAICNYCHKMGHLKRECPQSNQRFNPQVQHLDVAKPPEPKSMQDFFAEQLNKFKGTACLCDEMIHTWRLAGHNDWSLKEFVEKNRPSNRTQLRLTLVKELAKVSAGSLPVSVQISELLDYTVNYLMPEEDKVIEQKTWKSTSVPQITEQSMTKLTKLSSMMDLQAGPPGSEERKSFELRIQGMTPLSAFISNRMSSLAGQFSVSKEYVEKTASTIIQVLAGGGFSLPIMKKHLLTYGSVSLGELISTKIRFYEPQFPPGISAKFIITFVLDFLE